MSRRHFVALAREIRATEIDPEDKRSLAVRIANVCAAENVRFDRMRFLSACGVAR